MSTVRRPRGLRLRHVHGLYAVSPEMDELFTKLQQVAAADCTVLIGGESGTGKELVARAIHRESARRRAPFRAVNCATFSPTLLESELFGHVRGAFTGALRDRPGLFSLADRGTLLLDEVGEISHDLQGRLLRVLQERSFVPVGSTQPVSVDVRVVSATNKNLRTEAAEGRFRQDLLYRLRVVPIWLPPLRERRGDVEALIWHFIDGVNARGERTVEGVSLEAMNALRSYHWPGNVRELSNAIECAFVMGEGPTIAFHDLTPEVRGEPVPGVAHGDDRQRERGRVLAALARNRGSMSAAAADLGVHRTTLWRKMSTLHLRD
jgi:transcriptional regulator with PAS, ATPase and Fis domain